MKNGLTKDPTSPVALQGTIFGGSVPQWFPQVSNLPLGDFNPVLIHLS